MQKVCDEANAKYPNLNIKIMLEGSDINLAEELVPDALIVADDGSGSVTSDSIDKAIAKAKEKYSTVGETVKFKTAHGDTVEVSGGDYGNIMKVDGLKELLEKGCANFETMSSGNINSGGLIGALIAQKDSFVEGIKYAQEKIKGTMSLVIMTEDSIICARDMMGRLPIIIGKRSDGYCFSFESFAFQKLGYSACHELKAGEIVKLTKDSLEILSKGSDEMKMCTFLWTYYGYPNACYEGVNVEVMRTRNGEIMAETDIKNGKLPDVDYVCGVPDSGVPHAIGYANKSGISFARPFIKYTPTWPRSFMPASQSMRNKVAKMKLIPVHELIDGKRLLFVDDSIVRGTQLRETVEFLYENGAKEVHMRSACPPIMYGCKYLNFSRSTSELELIARQIIDENEGAEGIKYIEEYSDSTTSRGRYLRDEICRRLKLTSLEYQSLEGTVRAVGKPECRLCTYCWNGRE